MYINDRSLFSMIVFLNQFTSSQNQPYLLQPTGNACQYVGVRVSITLYSLYIELWMEIYFVNCFPYVKLCDRQIKAEIHFCCGLILPALSFHLSHLVGTYCVAS